MSGFMRTIASASLVLVHALFAPVLAAPTFTITDLGTLGGRWSFAYGLITLVSNREGWGLLDARAINNSGQIVGTGGIGGELHAYLLTPNVGTPVREPGTLLLLVMALACLSVSRWSCSCPRPLLAA